ncbi:MAG: hypothetical protein IKG55_04655, partial [Solobacterium sp.]|nr:hypothetical protein [Solobacterium sp.]
LRHIEKAQYLLGFFDAGMHSGTNLVSFFLHFVFALGNRLKRSAFRFRSQKRCFLLTENVIS